MEKKRKRERVKEFAYPVSNEKYELKRWRKIGGGHLRFGGHIVKPNEVFWAAEEDLPKAFMDLFEPLSIEKVQNTPPKRTRTKADEKPKQEVKEPEFEIVKNEDGKTYNIVNAETKKVINENPLTKKEADKLLKEI